MAAGPKLDGAGIQKMKTIDEANMQVQRLHGVVETYALALKRKQPTQLFSHADQARAHARSSGCSSRSSGSSRTRSRR